MKRVALGLLALALVVTAAGCGLRADPAAVEKAVRATLTALAPAARTPRPTFTLPPPTEAPTAIPTMAPPTATLPPVPTAKPTQLPTVDLTACAPAASFVADVTIPDNSRVSGGTTFTKIWRVKNDGKCAWNGSYRLTHASGELLGGPEFVPMGDIAAGAETEIAVTLKAPETPGTFKGVWQICAFGAACFGPKLSVVIVAGPAATPKP